MFSSRRIPSQLAHGSLSTSLTTRCGSVRRLWSSTDTSRRSLLRLSATDWWCPVDKIRAAEKIRQHLERRLAQLLGCTPEQLPRLRLGTCVHLLFALRGDSQDLGGFETSISGILQLLGSEIVWDIEEKGTTEETVQE